MFRISIYVLIIGFIVSRKLGSAYEFQTIEITTNIRYHVATTTRNIQVTNEKNETDEAKLYFMPPLDAVFTNLTMEIGNKTYEATLMKKKKAQRKLSSRTVFWNPSAMLETCEKWLEYDERVYKLIVNIEPLATVYIKLTYHQILRKMNGRYEYEVVVEGNKPSQVLNIDINICETKNIEITSVSPTTADIRFMRYHENVFRMGFLNITEQLSNKGVARLVLTYKLEDDEIPDVILGQRHFAYFGPELPFPSRTIMFIVQRIYDVDDRINEAMYSILDSLTSKDKIGIIKFPQQSNTWSEGKILSATPKNIKSAKRYLAEDHGWLGGGYEPSLELALKLMADEKKKKNQTINYETDFIVLFTNGYINERPGRVVKNVWVKNRAAGGFGINTLMYGKSVDNRALYYVAGQNYGVYNPIFTKFDLESQFKQYVRKIDETIAGGSPLNITYPESVSNVTSVRVPHGGVFTRTGKFNAILPTFRREPSYFTLTAQMQNTINARYETAMTPRRLGQDWFVWRCDSNIEENPSDHPAKLIYRIAKLQEALFYNKEAHYKKLKRSTKKIAAEMAYEYGLVSPHTSLFLTAGDPWDQL